MPSCQVPAKIRDLLKNEQNALTNPETDYAKHELFTGYSTYEDSNKPNELVAHFAHGGLAAAATQSLLLFPAEVLVELPSNNNVLASVGAAVRVWLIDGCLSCLIVTLFQLLVALVCLQRGRRVWDLCAMADDEKDLVIELFNLKSRLLVGLIKEVTGASDEKHTLLEIVSNIFNAARTEALGIKA